MKTLKVHSELQTLLPPLSDAEYQGLKADILEHGCLSPIVVWNDTIVDGHNRYAICQDHKLAFDTVELEFDTLDDAKFWAWQHQEYRRNLMPFQRVELALKFKPMLTAKGKANMSAGGGDKVSANAKAGCPTLDNPVNDTKKELAKIAGVSHGTLHKAEYLHDHADDETKQKLRNGDTTINKEYTRLRIAEQGEVIEDELEPLKATFPNPMDTFKESVTLQHILVHDTESLITCLFSLFDAPYRAQLILDILEKTESDDGQTAVETIIHSINNKYPITQ